MTRPGQTRDVALRLAGPGTGSGPRDGPASDFEARLAELEAVDPHEAAVVRATVRWVALLDKCLRTARVYASNNEILHGFLERAQVGLDALMELTDEVSLAVREDHLALGPLEVHRTSDRQNGLPFLLHRNAFRRLTFVRGFDRSELEALVGALVADYGPYDFGGEDLQSALWRLALPHLRYVTIDALTQGAARPGTAQELDAIQADIDGIIAAVYRTAAPDEDIVAGVRIGRHDLESLESIRAEDPEDLDRLDAVTERAIADIPPGQLERVRAEATADDAGDLTRRVLDVMVQLVFAEEPESAAGSSVDVLEQLFDGLLLAHRYAEARAVLERLDEAARSPGHGAPLADQLLALLSRESRVLPVLEALNDGRGSVQPSEVAGFLRAMGPRVCPALLGGLDHLDSVAHRKLLCDIIVELGVPPVSELERRTIGAQWFVVRDILELARHHRPDEVGDLVRHALQHEHPKVRAQALLTLRAYRSGPWDDLVVRHLRDADLEVRLVAARVASARRSRAVFAELEAIILEESFVDRDPREHRLLLSAYAQLGQGASVPTLDGLLHPGLVARLTRSSLQLAAATALGLIPSEAARRSLQRGTRSLGARVREACRRALDRTERGGASEDLHPRSNSAAGPPGAGPVRETSRVAPTPEAAAAESAWEAYEAELAREPAPRRAEAAPSATGPASDPVPILSPLPLVEERSPGHRRAEPETLRAEAEAAQDPLDGLEISPPTWREDAPDAPGPSAPPRPGAFSAPRRPSGARPPSGAGLTRAPDSPSERSSGEQWREGGGAPGDQGLRTASLEPLSDEESTRELEVPRAVFDLIPEGSGRPPPAVGPPSRPGAEPLDPLDFGGPITRPEGASDVPDERALDPWNEETDRGPG